MEKSHFTSQLKSKVPSSSLDPSLSQHPVETLWLCFPSAFSIKKRSQHGQLPLLASLTKPLSWHSADPKHFCVCCRRTKSVIGCIFESRANKKQQSVLKWSKSSHGAVWGEVGFLSFCVWNRVKHISWRPWNDPPLTSTFQSGWTLKYKIWQDSLMSKWLETGGFGLSLRRYWLFVLLCSLYAVKASRCQYGRNSLGSSEWGE